MVHRNAPLTELGRLRLARVIVDQGWPTARAAERFQLSRPTAHRWATRYRDRGRPGWRIGPAAPTTARTGPRRRWSVRSCTCAGTNGWAGPDRPPGRARSLHRAWILVRCRISRLAHLDRATGQPIRRYEHPHPGDLVHIDIKKLGNIPAGGGHRFLGRAAGGRNRQADRSSGRRSRHHHPLTGHSFIHAAVDDHSRLAYAEIHPDETSQTAAGFLHRTHGWFQARGITIQRVLTDNGGCYRSQAWQQLAITPKRTRPYRPQTNGKVCEDSCWRGTGSGLTLVKV